MNILPYIQDYAPTIENMGGKAFNLKAMADMEFKIPKWILIPTTAFQKAIENATTPESMEAAINHLQIDESLLTYLHQEFPHTTYFAVRSSAIGEDGANHSFAGQYESYLYVRLEDIIDKIKKVWLSANSERVKAYRQSNPTVAPIGIAVIIQEMIDAEVSGVGFGMNSINGDRNEKMISAVYGLGEGLVSGTLDADVYTTKEEKITIEIAEKTQAVTLNKKSKSGTEIINVSSDKHRVAALSNNQIIQINSMLEKLYNHFGKYQDIEFAIVKGELYLLQSRAITNLQNVANKQEAYILWDNSNIIESYPGITTPLTFSFINKSYEGAYRLFCEFLGVDATTIAAHEHVFKNTLGFINGRVYYNLKSWYQMLALVPGYSINKDFMENMMGVKEKFELPNHKQLSKTKAWWRTGKMIIQMLLRYQSMPKRRNKFQRLLNETIDEYKAIDFHTASSNRLMELYNSFEKKLLNEWKAPLLNDFFAMIWFGVLQKKTADYQISPNPNIHNDVLCGSKDIISTQPIHRTIALATMIQQNETLKMLFNEQDVITVWKTIKGNKDYEEIKIAITEYINDFGERCVGELKLETISYTQDPSLYIKVLQSYIQSQITAKSIHSSVEIEIRAQAEQAYKEALKGKFFKKWFINKAIKNTRELVSARENLRYERTRAFGIVRAIFTAMGDRFYAENIIENNRDIFYLTKEEIFSFIEGTAVTQDLNKLITLRKEEFKTYQNMEIPSERFATYGAVYHANDFFSKQKETLHVGDLKGIGCCPGIVKAKVMVVLHPNEVNDMAGSILVTTSTDPGWVTLFPSASGIIVERGSLLSHSAIVSREMGKPCIVGVSGLLQRLKTGDEIEMDGSTGFIKIINS